LHLGPSRCLLSELTDSLTTSAEGKRERLVRSAGELLHRHGVDRPTLADIARDAGVPPGNVYYYFKTRDELIESVIETRADGMRQLLRSLDQLAKPEARLQALARVWLENRDDIAAHGCPIGTLCSELNKRGRGLEEAAATLISLSLAWMTDQFRQLGHRDARELAVTMLATVQGAALLANTLRDPKIMTSQIRRLDRWIDSLADPEPKVDT
jgi:TetR/AcrR family transcriptional regulator, transcriptional repressor for nem operon